MWQVALCIVALVVISITHWVYRWRNPRCNGELPPGSMGLPLLGETLQFFTPTTSSNITPFIKDRINKYLYIYNLAYHQIISSPLQLTILALPSVTFTSSFFDHVVIILTCLIDLLLISQIRSSIPNKFGGATCYHNDRPVVQLF